MTYWLIVCSDVKRRYDDPVAMLRDIEKLIDGNDGRCIDREDISVIRGERLDVDYSTVTVCKLDHS